MATLGTGHSKAGSPGTESLPIAFGMVSRCYCTWGRGVTSRCFQEREENDCGLLTWLCPHCGNVTLSTCFYLDSVPQLKHKKFHIHAIVIPVPLLWHGSLCFPGPSGPLGPWLPLRLRQWGNQKGLGGSVPRCGKQGDSGDPLLSCSLDLLVEEGLKEGRAPRDHHPHCGPCGFPSTFSFWPAPSIILLNTALSFGPGL
jgi:hypothetical protein